MGTFLTPQKALLLTIATARDETETLPVYVKYAGPQVFLVRTDYKTFTGATVKLYGIESIGNQCNFVVLSSDLPAPLRQLIADAPGKVTPFSRWVGIPLVQTTFSNENSGNYMPYIKAIEAALEYIDPWKHVLPPFVNNDERTTIAYEPTRADGYLWRFTGNIGFGELVYRLRLYTILERLYYRFAASRSTLCATSQE